jgi:hypothetical protein
MIETSGFLIKCITSKDDLIDALEAEFDSDKLLNTLDVFVCGNFIEASNIVNPRHSEDFIERFTVIASYLKGIGYTDTKLKDVLKKCYDIIFNYNVDCLEICCYFGVPKDSSNILGLDSLYYCIQTELDPEEVSIINTKIKESLIGITDEDFFNVYGRRTSKYEFSSYLAYTNDTNRIYLKTIHDPISNSSSFKSVVTDNKGIVLKFLDECSTTKEAFDIALKYVATECSILNRNITE